MHYTEHFTHIILFKLYNNPMSNTAILNTLQSRKQKYRGPKLFPEGPKSWGWHHSQSLKHYSDLLVHKRKVAAQYYSAIKKNSFESVLMRWMKLEPIIQSEVSQKDKEHYSVLTHIYGI